ncbi:MAG TPA: zinc-binding dehydrogenase, partial [Gemmatimonadaceae bacterium]|nr:zinc-binding dehydrogenase [Gemmatimonadaceae bacterium]
MRALTISAHGGLDKLEYREDLPAAPVPPGHVRVRLRAAALNHLDLFVVEGLPGVTITPPWIMGADGAGVIEIGSGEIAPGDTVVINPGISDRTCRYCLDGEQSLCVNFRLLGEHVPGTFADSIVLPEQNVAKVTLGSDNDENFARAAAFPLAALTAWRMMVTRARVQPGEDVLIWGIGGGVAVACLQIAKMIGARAWVTSSSEAKLAHARKLGADEALNHRNVDVAKEIRTRTEKRGVDVVIDNVGQATWKQSLLSLRKGGRLVTCGATSGPMAEIDIRKLFWNQYELIGSTMGNDAEFASVVNEFNQGNLSPHVDSVYDLSQGR